MIWALLFGAAFFYGGLCLLMWVYQKRFIFFPQKISDQERNWLQEQFPGSELWLTMEDGAQLHGWYLQSKNLPAKTLMIYFGGNAEEVSANLPLAKNLPHLDQLFFNYRGYGASQGNPSQEKLFSDALEIFDYAKNQLGYAEDEIFLLGRSLGSGVAVYLASQRNPQGVILVTPFDSLRSVGQRAYPFLPVKYLLRHPFDSVQRARELKLPSLILVAELDEVIAPEHAQKLQQALKGASKLVVIPEANHQDIHLDPLYWKSIQTFVQENQNN